MPALLACTKFLWRHVSKEKNCSKTKCHRNPNSTETSFRRDSVPDYQMRSLLIHTYAISVVTWCAKFVTMYCGEDMGDEGPGDRGSGWCVCVGGGGVMKWVGFLVSGEMGVCVGGGGGLKSKFGAGCNRRKVVEKGMGWKLGRSRAEPRSRRSTPTPHNPHSPPHPFMDESKTKFSSHFDYDGKTHIVKHLI